MKKITLILPLLLLAAGCNLTTPKDQNNDQQTGNKTYTISDYTFEYPMEWQSKECIQQHSVDSEPFTIPDCALFSPVDITKGPFISTVKVKQKLDESIGYDGYSKNGFTREDLTIDGHQAVYIKTKAPEYEYIDNVYYIEDGDSIIKFVFREYEVWHPEGAPAQVFDSREYLDEFQSMVKSVRFR